MIKSRRAFIIGIKSLQLSKNEIYFLKKYKPWGVILFLRNIKTIKQTKSLTSDTTGCIYPFKDSFLHMGELVTSCHSDILLLPFYRIIDPIIMGIKTTKYMHRV